MAKKKNNNQKKELNNKSINNSINSLKHVEKYLNTDRFASLANISEKIAQINNPILNNSTFAALEKSTFNYELLLKSSSTLENSIKQINIDKLALDHEALMKSTSTLEDTIKKVDINKLTLSQEALLKSTSTLEDTIKKVDINKLSLSQEALLNSASTLATKINQYDLDKLVMKYSTLDRSITSLGEKLLKIDYSSLNNSIASLGENLSKIKYSSLNDSIISLSENLSKISIKEIEFRSFMNNFEKISNSTCLENFDLDSISYEEANNIKTSSVEIFEKLLTGTLQPSDVQNNKAKVYCIIIIKNLLAFLLGYMLSLGLNSFTNNLQNDNTSLQNSSLNSVNYENDLCLKIITTDNLNVRKEPSTKGEIIYQLETCDIVCVIGEQPYWYEIKYIDLSDNASKTGWIAKKYTKDYFSILDYYSEYFSE